MNSNEMTQMEVENNNRELAEDEYYDDDVSDSQTKKLTPQEELLESWYITLDDRVESLTNHIKGLNRKRTYYVGAGAAFVKCYIIFIYLLRCFSFIFVQSFAQGYLQNYKKLC